MAPAALGVRNFLAERAGPAIDDCEIARCSGRDASASVGSGIEQVEKERSALQSVEVTHRGTYGRAPPPAGYVKGVADEVLVCARANRDHIARRVRATQLFRPLGRCCRQATATVTPASTALSRPIAKRSLLPWYPPPSDRLRTSIQSAIAASTALRMSSLRAFVTSPGKTFVVTEKGTWRYSGHVIDAERRSQLQSCR